MVTLKDTKDSISTFRKQRFLRAQAVLKKAIDILINEYHANKIILIGSLADKHRFGFHSDIDLCVEGLPSEFYFKAVGELLLEADEFDIDIIPIEDATPKMRELIKNGKVLYEKR
ncbi:MAG: nucleotidyltransferase domain-containing protein [Nitrospirae bacterium]|nr:nucleotidyltransferase domain-containing protein [Nitrospirota bacterium]